MRLKIRILAGVFGCLFLFLIIRLFYWQIIKGPGLSVDARNQHTTSQITQASRGNILASDGSYWTIHTEVWNLIANTNLTKEAPGVIAGKIAPILAEDENSRLTQLLSKKSSYIVLKQKMDTESKKNVEALKIDGLRFEAAEGTFYPEASTAAQLLGFVGKDSEGEDVGYFGLEGYYNLPLSGKVGYVAGERDARGSPILLDPTKSISAVSGVDLATSIDKRIQILTEEKLKEGIEKYGAVSGNVTIVNPKTGAVLAMASYPSFDPAKYPEYSNEVFKNPVISDTFEPGSILKVLVMAAGLDAGVVKPDTECDICAGPLKLDKYFIKTWNNEYHANISMTDVIVHSDNVGMAFVGQKLGADKLYDYFDKFGLGKTTGVDLQGEAAPKLRARGTWNIVDLATASFGQGIAVTGIQVVRAVSAVANGGYIYTPRVVQTIKGDGWEEDTKLGPPQKVISSEAASAITQMMVQAAERGEAKWTRIPGFSVAGKTGTAQIAVEGHYDANNTNHSFVGFAPAENAKFVMLVTLKSPQSSPWAAETAAPLWYSIARELFPYLGIQPSE